MSYRCLMIVNPARIRCKNEQLLIETEEVHSVPIEDISAIVLESRQSTITTAAMAALAQNGVVTFWCDETHLPCGISLPFAQHSRQLGVLRWQMERQVEYDVWYIEHWNFWLDIKIIFLTVVNAFRGEKNAF